MRILSRIVLSFFLVMTFAGTALPWGNGPTHFSIGYDVDDIIPGYTDTFICANACPDIAWTQVFKARGLEYVHSMEFAECVYQVALAYSPWYPEWLAAAYGWGAHLAADEVIHPYITEEQPTHQLIELSIDTIVYYDDGPPEGWEHYNVGPDCCNPWLIYLASRLYRQEYPGVALAYPWRVFFALEGLRTTISAEYAYIQAKGSDDLSEWFLEMMIRQGNLEGDWHPYYVESVGAAQSWIGNHPASP
jgi:hypothetical protein